MATPELPAPLTFPMNAESYLRKQGWKGSGHSLDSTGRGIKKPLLIAHKQDQLGLGKKKAAWTTDDQWWMRAYDQSLQNIGTGEESTLNQIRTKGINRGGLYGFFVKGEAIAGTMDDSSANATDASMPPSGASTPLTSASETEASKKAAKKLDTKPKRKRKDDGTMAATKKAKRSGSKDSKEDKATQQDSAAPSKAQDSLSTKDRNAVTRKIAKLSSQKKALSEERAAAKKQTLEEYILRRISKKSAMRATRYAKPPPETLFFTDVKGDATLVNQRTTNTPLRPVLGIVEESLAGISLNAARTEEPESVTEKTPTKKPIKRHLPSANTKKMHYGRSVERGEQKSGTVDTRV